MLYYRNGYTDRRTSTGDFAQVNVRRLDLWLMSYTCFESEGSSSGRRLYIQVYTCKYNRYTCLYNRLPEDEPSDSKHIEDIKNYNIGLEKVLFIGLYCIIILQCTVQTAFKKVSYLLLIIHIIDYWCAYFNTRCCLLLPLRQIRFFFRLDL
jgi:hypothetical protein